MSRFVDATWSVTRLAVTAALGAGLALGAFAPMASADTGPAKIGPGYSSNEAGVTCVQKALALPMNGVPYGTYGQATYRRVRQFQAAHDVPETGAVGPQTARALFAATDLPGPLPDSCRAVLPSFSSDTTGNRPRADAAPPTPAGGSSVPGAGADSATCTDGSRSEAKQIAARGDFVELDPITFTNTSPILTQPSDWSAKVVLRYSSSTGCAWGLVDGYSSEHDVWIDRWRDGEATWKGPLGRRQVGYHGSPAANGGSTYTGVYHANGEYKVRACSQAVGTLAYHCTGWYRAGVRVD